MEKYQPVAKILLFSQVVSSVLIILLTVIFAMVAFVFNDVGYPAEEVFAFVINWSVSIIVITILLLTSSIFYYKNEKYLRSIILALPSNILIVFLIIFYLFFG